MTEAPGGSAGFGHGSDPEEHEALLRRIREFLRHGAAAEAGVEEWGEFAAQLRFLREQLAADVRGLLAEGQQVPAFPDAEQPSGLPSLRVDAEAGFACTGFSIRGLPAIGIQSSRNEPPLAFLVLDSDQLGELLERSRELLGTSA